MGVCGTSVQGEEADGLRELSSLSIRVPRVREGVARPVLPRLIAAGRLDTTALITHTYPLSDIEAAYDLFEHRRDAVMKVAITM